MREFTSATSHRPTWMALPVIGRAAVLALALLWSLPLAAQQGQITGLVTNAATGQPISSAQVFLPELNVGALSASNGRYLLLGVNAGTHTVRV
ncbi:MAG: carboxypeptidase regulatory-like domain-containing protein, partial [Gammaproteobacteria bacterium]|nr:carboxypeptidase regulatory-like domain-containing protein [Gammaproteobacteria bacterium]